VTVTDPKALSHLSDQALTKEAEPFAALSGAELLILGTEWDEYKKLDPAQAIAMVKTPTVIDGRNVLDVKSWQAAGWKVIALGRSIVND
jgi:UDPglucose 6-dehydrogenase